MKKVFSMLIVALALCCAAGSLQADAGEDMPLMQALGVDGTLRISLALYNSRAEIDALIHALRQLPEFF